MVEYAPERVVGCVDIPKPSKWVLRPAERVTSRGPIEALVRPILGRGRLDIDEAEEGWCGIQKKLVKSQDDTTKSFDGPMLVDKAESMSDWILVGAWRFLRFCNKRMLKALMFSRCLLARSLLWGLKISIRAFTALLWYNSRPLEREAGLPRTESLICLSIGTY